MQSSPLGKRRFSETKKKKSKYELMIDGKDRDGFVLKRKSDKVSINKNISLYFEPQLLIQRAILCETNSYSDSKANNKKEL